MLAVALTIAWHFGKMDLSPLLEDANVRRGEVWRFLTSMWPHGNALHLIFNAYWTWVLGSVVEEEFGHVRAALIIAILALGSGAAEYALYEGGIGLSGVGYGIFAMLWVLSTRDRRRFADVVDRNTVQLFVAWFFACIVMTWAGVMRVGNVAHGAGAVLGAVLGFAVAGRPWERIVASIGAAVLVSASVAGAMVWRPWINLAKDAYVDEARLGYAALEAGRDEEGARWYRDAVRMSPGTASNWYNLGVAYLRLGRLKEALRAYERAHELDPGDANYERVWREVKEAAAPGEALSAASRPSDQDEGLLSALGKMLQGKPATTRSK
jgi:membrane associated rhomboid family serine protease